MRVRQARGGRCTSCGREGELEENDLCATCDEAYINSIQAAEQAFELGANYGRVMGWYDEPNEDGFLDDQREPW